MRKIRRLQALRAAAAILVVWFHSIYLITDRQLSSVQANVANLAHFGAVGVDIFFVISGFIVSITAERVDSPTRFLRDRARRIWPLYLISSLVVLAVAPWRPDWLPRLIASSLFLQVPSEIRGFPTNPVGWSLNFEVGFYLLLAAAMAWRGPRPVAERAIILLAGLLTLASLFGFPQPLNVYGNPIALEFAAGIGIGMFWKRWHTLPDWLTSALFVSGVVLLVSTALYGGDLPLHDALNTMDASLSWQRVRIWGIGSALLVASMVMRPDAPVGWRLLVFLGDASYSIYLFAPAATSFLDQHWALLAKLSPDVAILVATALGVGLGTLLHVAVERPLQRRLDSRRPATRNAASALIRPT